MSAPLRVLIGLTVCSGIGVPELSAPWIDWRWQSEVDKAAARVLAHRFPDAVNLGDMTKYQEWPDAVRSVDILAGGTPCQDFSIAGARAGLDGGRGQLSLVFGEIAARFRPSWVVWENVPGVLSNNDGRDFAEILGMLSGWRVQVPDGGWKNSGIVPGLPEAYGLAFVVRDAQYVRTSRHPRAVPQRRRRVFVVGYLGDWTRAAQVLFDAESLCGNPPPRREAGQDAAGTLSARAGAGGGLGTDFELGGGLTISNSGDASYCLTASAQQSLDAETETLIAAAHTLRGDGFDASDDGTGRGTPIVPVAFDCKGTEVQFTTDGSTPTLRLMGHSQSHQNAGGHQAVAIQERAVSENVENGPDGRGWRDDGAAYTLEARSHVQAVAFDPNQITSKSNRSTPRGDVCHTIPAKTEPPMIASRWAVRRLTPTECERLQGLEDGFTDTPVGDKRQADGPRYKQLGNAWALNSGESVFEGIRRVEGLLS